MQVLGAAAIETLLPMAPCIEVVAGAMRAISSGEVLAPTRQLMALQSPNAMGVMPGAMPALGVFGVKVLALYPGNGARGLPSHAGMVLLFDAASGAPVAVLESHMLTALRTAAASAVATRALARPGSSVLAILGSGHQALWHVRAMREVLRLRRLQLWNHHPVGAHNLIARLGRLDGIEVVVAESAQQALEGADVVCTVTAAHEPVILGEWLVPGQHVNLVGASVAADREADDEVVRRGRFFVDARASAAVQAGEWLHATAAGVVRADHLQGEIGEVLLGDVRGRLHKEDVTVYKSLGHAAQDLATADAVLRMARASGQYPELAW